MRDLLLPHAAYRMCIAAWCKHFVQGRLKRVTAEGLHMCISNLHLSNRLSPPVTCADPEAAYDIHTGVMTQ